MHTEPAHTQQSSSGHPHAEPLGGNEEYHQPASKCLGSLQLLSVVLCSWTIPAGGAKKCWQGRVCLRGSQAWRLNQVWHSQLPWDEKNPFYSPGSSLKNHKADIRYLQPPCFLVKSSDSKVLIQFIGGIYFLCFLNVSSQRPVSKMFHVDQYLLENKCKKWGWMIWIQVVF